MKHISIVLSLLMILSLDMSAQNKALPAEPFDLDKFNGRLPFDVPVPFKKEYKGNVAIVIKVGSSYLSIPIDTLC